MKNFALFLLAQDPAAAENGGGNWNFLIMMLLIFVVMWLFMIRPQQKKQKEIEKAREAMKNGDKVVTAGGIHGKIKQVEETTFLVEVAPNTCIRFDKTSVFADSASAAAATANAEEKK